MKYELETEENNWRTELKGTDLSQKFRERLHNKYLAYRGDSLQNAIFRIWTFKPNKDLDECGKRKKSLACYYNFNELDIMREVFFSELIREIDSKQFLNTAFKPKTTQEFVALTLAFNNEMEFLIQKLRTTFHRHWGFRIYQLPAYLVNGVEVKKYCLVPTDPKAIDFIKNHPQGKGQNIFVLKNRTEIARNTMKVLERKLGTFRKELDATIRQFNKMGWN